MFIHCPRHRTAVEWQSEPMRPPPPPDQVCPQCIAERHAPPTRTGTSSSERVLSAATSDEEFLAGTRNPEARKRLLELRDRQREELAREAKGAALLDADRPLQVDYDRAKTVRERRAVTRQMMRAAKGPSW